MICQENKKTALFLQSFGLGDCIFAHGIAVWLIKQGYKVIWPVKSDFVDGLQRAYPLVQWMPDVLFNPNIFNIKQDVVINGVRIIPIRWADSLLGVPSRQWMRAKYDYYGLDWNGWRTYRPARRKSRELSLAKHMGVDLEKPFNLVNKTYRSDFGGNVNIKIENDYPTYEIKIREGYSLFDYSLLIEEATEIHVANSSVLYLLELLDYKGIAHIYARPEEGGGFPYVDYIMTKPYVLHG